MRLRKPKVDGRLTRAEFRHEARPVAIRIGGHLAGEAKPRESKNTGSLGWGLTAKLYLNVGGQTVYCQVNASVTIIGSKDSPEGEPQSEVINLNGHDALPG